MTSENTITIDLFLDTGDLKTTTTKVAGSMNGLQRVVNNLETAINNAFTPKEGMQDMDDWISILASVIAYATLELQNLTALLTTQHEETMWSAWRSDAINCTSTMVDMYAAYQALLAMTGALTVAGTAQSSAWAIVNAVETLCTSITTALGAAMTFLTSPIGLVVVAITALIAIVVLLIQNWDTVKATILTAWEAIKQVLATAAEWVDHNLLQPIIEVFTSAMDWISVKVQEGIAFVQSIFAGINEFLQGVFARDFTEQFGAFGNVLNAFFANVENIWNAVKSIFGGILGFIKSVFAGDWGAAWDSVVGIFKGVWDLLVAIVKAPINGIIGLINGLVKGVVDGINLVIKALNSISFDIPDWVPLVGGETFGFNLAMLKAPQIPYLAQGAVLPANRPFLAVVGDQRHGTNVEAPLETIQEAVAVVIDDYVSAMMAGFEALLAEQRATRQAVESIHIGDDVLYKAVQRRSRVMAIARGGL